MVSIIKHLRHFLESQKSNLRRKRDEATLAHLPKNEKNDLRENLALVEMEKGRISNQVSFIMSKATKKLQQSKSKGDNYPSSEIDELEMKPQKLKRRISGSDDTKLLPIKISPGTRKLFLTKANEEKVDENPKVSSTEDQDTKFDLEFLWLTTELTDEKKDELKQTKQKILSTIDKNSKVIFVAKWVFGKKY